MAGERPASAGERLKVAVQAVLFVGLAIALALSAVAFLAGSLPLTFASGATALLGASAYVSGRPRLAAVVIALGLLGALLVWQIQAGPPRRPATISTSLAGRQLRSGTDPSLCGPVGVSATQLVFTLKPEGYSQSCARLPHGVSVDVRADPEPALLVGGVTNGLTPERETELLDRPATAAEGEALRTFSGRATPMEGAWSACSVAACTLVFRDGALLVAAKWLTAEAGSDPRAVRRQIQDRLAAWAPR